MVPSTVTTIMKNADKIKKKMETARRKSATPLQYSHDPVTGKMEQSTPTIYSQVSNA
jgi:hypothetical protein